MTKAVVIELFNKGEQKMYYGVKFGSLWIDADLRLQYMDEARWFTDKQEADDVAAMFNEANHAPLH